MTRKKVLIFIDWFSPAFKAGGPIKSVTNIVNSLYEDCLFDIATSDRDLGDLCSFQEIILNEWIEQDRYRVIYLTPENRTKKIKNLLESSDYDYIYMNSAFSKGYTISPLRLIKKLEIRSKVVIAPRGMLGKGALGIKPIKKKIFLYFAKLTSLYSNVVWHATNDLEKVNVTDIFGESVQCKIAGNISATEVKRVMITKEVNSLKLVFFSRISIKKNISYILELLEELSISTIELDIYGPIEDEAYWNVCLKHIERINGTIRFKGPVEPVKVQETLTKYHFFILPTLHENYGHVIVEALVSGCGLILSDQTPWSELESNGVGWSIPLANKPKWLIIIRKCYEMSQDEYSLLRDRSFEYALKTTDDTIAIKATKELFNN